MWREAAAEANARLEIAVADAADGRFVPDLDITLTLLEGDRELFTTTMPFLWHPYLHHYGTNARVPGEGPYSVRVRIDPPTFMRHDPVNGKRYEQPADLGFDDLRFKPGRKPSPDAQPRGPDAPYAGRPATAFAQARPSSHAPAPTTAQTARTTSGPSRRARVLPVHRNTNRP